MIKTKKGVRTRKQLQFVRKCVLKSKKTIVFYKF